MGTASLINIFKAKKSYIYIFKISKFLLCISGLPNFCGMSKEFKTKFGELKNKRQEAIREMM